MLKVVLGEEAVLGEDRLAIGCLPLGWDGLGTVAEYSSREALQTPPRSTMQVTHGD